MRKLLLLLCLLSAPGAMLMVSCGSSTPTAVSTPTPGTTTTPTPGNPTATFTPTPSVKTLATFPSNTSLQGLCLDSSDNVYVADYNRSVVYEITSAGVTSALESSIGNPYTVAYDSVHSAWYITGDNSPHFYIYSGGVTTGTSNISSGFGYYGAAVNASATTLCVLTGGFPDTLYLYALPAYTSISSISLPIGPTFTTPQAVAFDNSGNLYVTGGTEILEYVGATGSPVTVAGSTTSGYTDGAAGSSLLSGVRAIATDSNGNLYMADGGNHAIRELSNGTVKTLVGPAANNPAATMTLSNPDGISVDASGNVFFSDAGLYGVYEYSL